jgi:hypothetical protein
MRRDTVTTLRHRLGCLAASIALWLLEPRGDEAFDAERSRRLDELVERLEREFTTLKASDTFGGHP